MDAYRVTMKRHRKLGLHEWDEKKTIPLATRQRVLCILTYQRDLPKSERWDVNIERAPIVDDWQPVAFTLPFDRDIKVQLDK